MGDPGIIQITPFFGTGPLDRAIAFYTDVLGCCAYAPGGGYAYVSRDRFAVRLLELDAGSRNPPGCGHAYVDVANVDALFAELAPKLAALPADRWGPVEDHNYGQREFWLRDPDGNLINFGQQIAGSAVEAAGDGG